MRKSYGKEKGALAFFIYIQNAYKQKAQTPQEANLSGDVGFYSHIFMNKTRRLNK